MARVESMEVWESSLTMDAARSAVLDYLDRAGVFVEDRGGERITGRQGSQLKTRLLGGWFVNPASFPKIVTVSLTDTPDGVRIEARIEESMGFGYMDKRFKGRYETYFAQVMAGLKDAAPPRGQ